MKNVKYRLVIKDLRKPAGADNCVKVVGDTSKRAAEIAQERFTKLRWDQRRPGVLTIDHIALCVEIDE